MLSVSCGKSYSWENCFWKAFHYAANFCCVITPTIWRPLSVDCHFDYISHVNHYLTTCFLFSGRSKHFQFRLFLVNIKSLFSRSTGHYLTNTKVIVSDLSKLSCTFWHSSVSRWTRQRSALVNLSKQSISVLACDWKCTQLARKASIVTVGAALLQTCLHVFVAISASETKANKKDTIPLNTSLFTFQDSVCHPGKPMKRTTSPLPEVIVHQSSSTSTTTNWPLSSGQSFSRDFSSWQSSHLLPPSVFYPFLPCITSITSISIWRLAFLHFSRQLLLLFHFLAKQMAQYLVNIIQYYN